METTGTSPRRAFTLIEVLVVVAIIALLAAILLPSLQRARDQAKIGVCKASLQQIGRTGAIYQASEASYSPVLLNYYFTGYPGAPPVPARARFASVAMRRYDLGRPLPPKFNPEASWDKKLIDEYTADQLPRHWVCPFVREEGNGKILIGQRLVKGTSTAQMYQLWEWRGRQETFHPWLWEEVVRGKSVRGDQERHPNDPKEGRPKYSVITFNRIKLPLGSVEPDPPGAIAANDGRLYSAARKWSDSDARRRYSASLSDMTMMYCAQGSFLAFEYAMNNPAGHRTASGAGTDTVFADGHVEWVKGTNIGWP